MHGHGRRNESSKAQILTLCSIGYLWLYSAHDDRRQIDGLRMGMSEICMVPCMLDIDTLSRLRKSTPGFISSWNRSETGFLSSLPVSCPSLARFGLLLKYCVPYRNRTRIGGQSIAGHESDVVGSNSYLIM